jgi:hypothetical protein
MQTLFMDLLIEIIKATHWWVYVVFSFLILVGLRSTKPRTVSARQLFLLPFILMFLNLIWLSERIHNHSHLLIFWFLGLAAGAIVGWLMVRKWTVKTHRYDQISLPSSWSVLILILLFFSIRYYFLFNYEMHPKAATHLFMADALISGVMTGIFIGRAYHLFTKYHRIS